MRNGSRARAVAEIRQTATGAAVAHSAGGSPTCQPWQDGAESVRQVARTETGTAALQSLVDGRETATDWEGHPLPSPLPNRHGGAWEQVYPGSEEQLAPMRAALRSLLRGCPVADDVVLVMSELAANAIRHSRSGREGGTFTARLQHVPGRYVLGEIEDGGSDWGGDLQRSAREASGLYILLQLAADSGVSGDQRKRVVWFRIPCPADGGTRVPGKAAAA